ncbi:MAG: hypothetical protein HY952_02595 [Elusimicrobia bacterium]|nr:hypothetical protein [Elusimicrobiota bacterium]
MQNLKKAGYPLMFLSIVLFGYAKRSEGMLLNWIAAGMMLAGMVLFVISALFPPPDDESAPGRGPFSPALSTPSDNYYREAARRDTAGPREGETPGWVYLLGGAVTVVGFIGFLFSPNGVHTRSVVTFAMIPGGVLLIVLGHAVIGGAIGLRNLVRGTVALLGFLMILGGIFTGVLLAAGNFDVGERLPWAAGAVLSFLAGIALAYYGFKYQQGREGVSIGRELGLRDAESGLFARDGVYDSVGEFDGVEVKINVEQEEAQYHKGHTTPAHFRLEVLCGCANARGVRLKVLPSGITGIHLTSLPKLPPLEYWDGYDVMCDSAENVTRPLREVKGAARTFSQESGLSTLSLEENALAAVFELEGHARAGYVRDVLGDLTALVKALG